MPYEQWETRALAHVRDSEFLALSLHDCYGPTWIAQYPAFLGRLQAQGTLQTLDQVRGRGGARRCQLSAS